LGILQSSAINPDLLPLFGTFFVAHSPEFPTLIVAIYTQCVIRSLSKIKEYHVMEFVCKTGSY
jgi:hypothetical protein